MPANEHINFHIDENLETEDEFAIEEEDVTEDEINEEFFIHEDDEFDITLVEDRESELWDEQEVNEDPNIINYVYLEGPKRGEFVPPDLKIIRTGRYLHCIENQEKVRVCSEKRLHHYRYVYADGPQKSEFIPLKAKLDPGPNGTYLYQNERVIRHRDIIYNQYVYLNGEERWKSIPLNAVLEEGQKNQKYYNGQRVVTRKTFLANYAYAYVSGEKKSKLIPHHVQPTLVDGKFYYNDEEVISCRTYLLTSLYYLDGPHRGKRIPSEIQIEKGQRYLDGHRIGSYVEFHRQQYIVAEGQAKGKKIHINAVIEKIDGRNTYKGYLVLTPAEWNLKKLEEFIYIDGPKLGSFFCGDEMLSVTYSHEAKCQEFYDQENYKLVRYRDFINIKPSLFIYAEGPKKNKFVPNQNPATYIITNGKYYCDNYQVVTWEHYHQLQTTKYTIVEGEDRGKIVKGPAFISKGAYYISQERNGETVSVKVEPCARGHNVKDSRTINNNNNNNNNEPTETVTNNKKNPAKTRELREKLVFQTGPKEANFLDEEELQNVTIMEDGTKRCGEYEVVTYKDYLKSHHKNVEKKRIKEYVYVTGPNIGLVFHAKPLQKVNGLTLYGGEVLVSSSKFISKIDRYKDKEIYVYAPNFEEAPEKIRSKEKPKKLKLKVEDITLIDEKLYYTDRENITREIITLYQYKLDKYQYRKTLPVDIEVRSMDTETETTHKNTKKRTNDTEEKNSTSSKKNKRRKKHKQTQNETQNVQEIVPIETQTLANADESMETQIVELMGIEEMQCFEEQLEKQEAAAAVQQQSEIQTQPQAQPLPFVLSFIPSNALLHSELAPPLAPIPVSNPIPALAPMQRSNQYLPNRLIPKPKAHPIFSDEYYELKKDILATKYLEMNEFDALIKKYHLLRDIYDSARGPIGFAVFAEGFDRHKPSTHKLFRNNPSTRDAEIMVFKYGDKNRLPSLYKSTDKGFEPQPMSIKEYVDLQKFDKKRISIATFEGQRFYNIPLVATNEFNPEDKDTYEYMNKKTSTADEVFVCEDIIYEDGSYVIYEPEVHRNERYKSISILGLLASYKLNYTKYREAIKNSATRLEQAAALLSESRKNVAASEMPQSTTTTTTTTSTTTSTTTTTRADNQANTSVSSSPFALYPPQNRSTETNSLDIGGTFNLHK